MRSYQSYIQEEELSNSGRIRALVIVCGAVLIALAALGVAWVAYVQRDGELARADAVMAMVQATAVSEPSPDVQDRPEDPVDEVPEEATGPVTGQLYSNDPLYRGLNWDGIHAINQDIAFWLYVPGTAIDYPVMSEAYAMDGAEYFYLRHDVNGERVSSGSLFTVRPPGDAADAHMTIFGHNMGGGREIMFGTLQRYKDPEFRAENPYAYVYYPDHAERWEVWSAGNVKNDDEVYSMPFEIGSGDYASLLDHMGAASMYESGVAAPSADEPTVTLSTCDTGYAAKIGRFTVHLKLVESWYPGGDPR